MLRVRADTKQNTLNGSARSVKGHSRRPLVYYSELCAVAYRWTWV